MSQHDMTIEDGTGLSVRENINFALAALVSTSSGPTEPGTSYPGQMWLDTSILPDGVLRMRNVAGDAWVSPPSAIMGGGDMWFGTRLSADRFVWNDKIDGTGNDIMSLSESGLLRIDANTSAALELNKASGTATQYSYLRGMTNHRNRWDLYLGDGVAESGGNAGSNAQLLAYDDAGTLIGTALSFERSSLALTTGGSIHAARGYTTQEGDGGTAGGSVFNISWNGSPELWIDTTNLGIISVSSDYRIKKDKASLPSMWETLKTLHPIRYTQADAFNGLFVADDKERWGFVAHELQAALIEDAATGVKDDPAVVQSPNPWTLLAAVVKTLQECQARIEALETA